MTETSSVGTMGKGKVLADTTLEARGISKTFYGRDREVVALDNVDLTIRRGEFISLLGPSGCGKTTLLRIIAGLERADAGEIFLNGERLSGVSKDMGYVFQEINLLPWRSVIGNVELALEARAVPKKDRRALAMETLKTVGLTAVADSPPYTLSGGMQQRVGVTRALVASPKVLLMDEPFGQLDNFTREALQVDIAELWSRLGMTIVFVTHDVDEAIFLSDRVVLFASNPGRITEVVEVDLPRPRTSYEARNDNRSFELRKQVRDHLHRLGEIR